jgi:hypothetical protein
MAARRRCDDHAAISPDRPNRTCLPLSSVSARAALSKWAVNVNRNADSDSPRHDDNFRRRDLALQGLDFVVHAVEPFVQSLLLHADRNGRVLEKARAYLREPSLRAYTPGFSVGSDGFQA